MVGGGGSWLPGGFQTKPNTSNRNDFFIALKFFAVQTEGFFHDKYFQKLKLVKYLFLINEHPRIIQNQTNIFGFAWSSMIQYRMLLIGSQSRLSVIESKIT